MSGKNMELIRQMLAGRLREASSFTVYATVKEVDEAKRTCKAEIGDVVYEDILLYSIENPLLKGFVFIPSIDSRVLVSRVGTDRLYVVQFSQVDKVILTLNDLELTIDADIIDLKKGENITVRIDADKLEVVNDTTTIKVTTAGLTLKKGGSGLKKTLENLLDGLCQLTVPTGVGPSGVPINIAIFQQIKADLPNYMEE